MRDSEGEICQCAMPKPRHAGVHPTVCKGCNGVIEHNAEADNNENWGGDPEGPLAKALEKARKESKKPKKPLKIEKLDTESFEATAYSMIEHHDDYVLKEIADSLRPKYNLEWNEGELSWDYDMKTGNVILHIYDGDNNKLDAITYDRKALAKALKEQGHKNPESWGAEGNGEDMVSCNHCWNKIGSEKEVHVDETVKYEMANDELVCIPCYNIWMKEYENDLDPHYTPFYAESFGGEPIVIDGYMPKRVEVFRDTILFYIGDSAEKRYGHSGVERKLLGDISIIDSKGITKGDIEKLLKREWDGRFLLFEDGGTFVGNVRTYGSEGFEQVHCSKCKRMGYSDQMKEVSSGHLCTRCSRQDIDWGALDKQYGIPKSHRYYHPPTKEDKDSLITRYLNKRNQKRGARKGDPFSWLIIGTGVALVLVANKMEIGK